MDRAPFWRSLRRRHDGRRDPRRRALFWITVGCLLFGLLELGAPAEYVLRSVRDIARRHPASGQVVIVGIDEDSIHALQEWPLRRRHYAQLIDRLNALGARRIFITTSFTTRSTPADDAMLAAALARSRSRVVLPTMFFVDPITGRRTDLLPIADFRRHAAVGNVNAKIDAEGVARRLPYAMEAGGAIFPSFAAALARVSSAPGSTFPLDYSIDLGSIPIFGAADILSGRTTPDRIHGHDVMIGTTAMRFGDSYVAPLTGRVPSVYLHALGAETLLTGVPVDLPWILPFALAWTIATFLIFSGHKILRRTLYGLGTVATLASPFLLDARMILVDIMPTIMLLATTGLWALWTTYRRSYRQRAIVNVVSGLPNLNALRAVASVPEMSLVAARVRNFPEVAASLAAEKERVLVEQIARRLALGSGGATIYQGDEGIFAWLMPSETLSFTSDQFDALQALFRNPVAVGERHVDLAITFGLASDPNLLPFNRLGGALMAADAAAEAGLHWKLHEPVEASDSVWKLSLLSSLDAAIDAGEIWVAYQPKIDLSSSRVVGAEALVRWTHPEKGPISPNDFIPTAEQQNRIGKLTYHVMETAIRTAAAINAHGIEFGIAVNLSTRLLHDPRLVERVSALLRRHGLAPKHLTLEITETAALADSDQLIAMLRALRAIGLGLSIDDYGTGFSNLENLRTIPASEIKIDRSFVDAIDHSRSDAVMVRSTIQMAHSLGQTVVAEGVERNETLRTLRAMGCDQVQGYLTGRPMKFASLSRTLILDQRKHAA